MDYHKYKTILEFIPKNVDISNINNEKFSLAIKEFISFNEIKNVLISLSGGVDSMVLAFIIKHFQEINLYCCHINYNNRIESCDERDFLIDWCKINNIHLEVKNIDHIRRGEINRNEYEEETRSIRYDYYKELINQYNCEGVFLGHHRDDLSENVFNNIMRGRKDITDLSVFKKENTIMGVTVFRPMLDFKKDIIYKISEDYQVPYFLDTTPDWSCRGKMRRQIFPKCEDCYSDSFMNSLVKLGKQSDELDHIMNKYMIDPIINSVILGRFGFIIPKTEILKEGLIFRQVMRNIFEKLYIRNVKSTSLNNFLENYNNNIQIHLINGYFTFIEDTKIIFVKERIIDKIDWVSKKIIEESDINNSINELIHGKLYFIWRKKKYMPNYNYDSLKKKIGSLQMDNYGKNLLINL
tara:strand:+ start:77 stop:1306 length:1230 start_codon:yes stop_codon:yes gene_type:complete